MPLRPISGFGLFAAQLAAVLTGLTALAGWPPANGRILIVPLSANAASTLVGRAIGTGARLLGRGPIPGSIVVEGSRTDLATALETPRVLLIAAPPAGCHA